MFIGAILVMTKTGVQKLTLTFTTTHIVEVKMERHNWSQSGFELSGPHGTQPFQHYECRLCRTTVRKADNRQHPTDEEAPSCTGFKKIVVLKQL